MIQRIHLQGFRSLRNVELKLGPLNILIGPNAAGKSNLIDAFRLLSETVISDTETAVANRGGLDAVSFWGNTKRGFELEIDYFVPDLGIPRSCSTMSYEVEIRHDDGRPAVRNEALREPGSSIVWFRAKSGKGKAIKDPTKPSVREPFDTGDPGVVALKALGFLSSYPQIRALREFIEDWQFLSVNLDAVRAPRRDARATRLAADASNLSNVLRTLQGSETYQRIMRDLYELLERIEEVRTSVDRGRVLLLVKEQPFEDPAEALSASDGTLRLLAFLTALHTMPEHGLLCVEEPEHGLHPLLFGPLLDLIRERCPEDGSRQVILTTHSPDVVDAAEPEEVIVAQRDHDGATQLERLDPEALRQWLEDFRLGELWRMRQIGGVPR